jgi:hypothetical protein
MKVYKGVEANLHAFFTSAGNWFSVDSFTLRYFTLISIGQDTPVMV